MFLFCSIGKRNLEPNTQDDASSQGDNVAPSGRHIGFGANALRLAQSPASAIAAATVLGSAVANSERAMRACS